MLIKNVLGFVLHHCCVIPDEPGGREGAEGHNDQKLAGIWGWDCMTFEE